MVPSACPGLPDEGVHDHLRTDASTGRHGCGGQRDRQLRGDALTDQVPLVDYLVLGDEPHLVAHECTDCSARYFDRRNACARCGGAGEDQFRIVAIPNEGELRTFTIVSFAAPGIPVPFVAGVIDCGGTPVRGNVVNVEPDADHVSLGMPVRLTTFGIGEDSEGTEAVGFGYEPIDPAEVA